MPQYTPEFKNFEYIYNSLPTEKNKNLVISAYYNNSSYGNKLIIISERGRTNFEIEDILNYFSNEEINNKSSNNVTIDFQDNYGKEHFFINSDIINKTLTIDDIDQKPTDKEFSIIIIGNVLLENSAFPMLPENKIFIKIPMQYFFFVGADDFLSDVSFDQSTGIVNKTYDGAFNKLGILLGFKEQNLTINEYNQYINNPQKYIKLFAKDFYEFDKQEIYLSTDDFIRNPDEANNPSKNFGYYLLNSSITCNWLIKRNRFGNILYRDSNNYMKINAQFGYAYIESQVGNRDLEIIHNKKRIKRETINIDRTIKEVKFGKYNYKDSELYGASYPSYSTASKYVKINNQELTNINIKNAPKILSVQKSNTGKNDVVLRVKDIINAPSDYRIYTAGYQNNGVIISGKTPKAKNGKVSNLAPVDLS